MSSIYYVVLLFLANLYFFDFFRFFSTNFTNFNDYYRLKKKMNALKKVSLC